MLIATLLAPNAAGASTASCSGWTTSSQSVSKFNTTISRNTDARRGPSSHSSCDRNFDYTRGTKIRVEGQSGNYYWVTNTSTGDWAWIAKSAVSGATTNTVSTNTAANTNPKPGPNAGGSCNRGWVTSRQNISNFDAVVSRTTRARRGPDPSSSCDRDFDYTRGTKIRVEGQSGNYYWATNPANGDVTWILKNAVSNTTTVIAVPPTNTAPAPTVPQRERVQIKSRQLLCDGNLRTVAAISGFAPYETVGVYVNRTNYIKSADKNGYRVVNWQCNTVRDSNGSYVPDTPRGERDLEFIVSGESIRDIFEFEIELVPNR